MIQSFGENSLTLFYTLYTFPLSQDAISATNAKSAIWQSFADDTPSLVFHKVDPNAKLPIEIPFEAEKKFVDADVFPCYLVMVGSNGAVFKVNIYVVIDLRKTILG